MSAIDSKRTFANRHVGFKKISPWLTKLLTKLRKAFIDANYGALALESVVVIVGILVAFQIDRWGVERQERRYEHQYLVRLKEDLLFEIGLMDVSIEYADRRIDSVRFLERVAANPDIYAERQADVVSALERVTWRSFPHISAFVYTELQSTGSLSLVQSDELRQNLAEYYSYLRFESVIGLDLEVQRTFSRLTAGILSTDELVNIEEDRRSEGQVNMPPGRALQIARQFSDRRDAIDLLPSIAQHHAFNKKIIVNSRDRAQKLVELLDALIAESI
jgi:hypothetical protein